MAQGSIRSVIRQRLLAQFGALYERHYSEQGGCFYCGDDATTRDHVPPLDWFDSRTIEAWKKDKIPFVKVNSCAACNGALGSKPLFTVAERLPFLEKNLSTKYERAAALWSDEEIKEMSPRFQKMIRARRAGLILLHNRLRHVQWRVIHVETHPWLESAS